MMDADRELELVKRAQAGDRESYGRLVDMYGGLVLAIAYSRIGNYTASQDIAQDAFLLGFENLAALRQPGRFGVWLSTITRNLSRNWRKSQAYRERLHADSVALRERLGYAQAPGAAEKVEQMEMRTLIDEALGELPVRDRESIILYYFEGKSTDEAARALGISPAAMRKRLERARRRLRDRMAVQVEAGLLETAKERRMSSKVLAALPLGASFAKIAPVTSVLPSAPILHVTGIIAKAGGIVMSTNKTTGIVAVICAVLLCTSVGFQMTRARRPAEETADARPKTASSIGLQKRSAARRPAEALLSASPSQSEPTKLADALVKNVERTEPTDGKQEEAALPASVSGYVMDDQGYPLEGASVDLEIVDDEPGTVIEVYEAKTDSDGTYEIGGVNIFGTGSVYASADGYVMQREMNLEMTPGAQRDNVNFTLPKARFLIAGWVVSENRQPIPAASVNLRYGRSDGGRMHHAEFVSDGLQSIWFPGGDKLVFALTDDEGYFQLAVPWNAMCDFTVVKDGYGTGFFPEIPAGTDDAVFVLQPGGAISGTVTREDGGAIEGVIVQAAGEAYPGSKDPEGRTFASPLRIRPVIVHTDLRGGYIAEGLSEDYFYVVTATDVASGEAGWAASKRAVGVKAGQTTSGIDFVLRSLEPARIYGEVRCPTSGMPVYPLRVYASVVEGENELAGDSHVMATTAADGSYELAVNLAESVRLRIGWQYATEGGDPEAAILDLGPSEEEELNLAVAAPICVPVKLIDKNGTPLEGIGTTIWDLESNGRWGGGPVSDADGRVLYEGLGPGRTYRMLGQNEEDVIIGTSEPFSGLPGETIPEVEVVCTARGGIEGIIIGSDGDPVANTMIGCTALLDDGTGSELARTTTDEHGRFVILNELPEGVHSRVAIAYLRSGMIERIVLDRVEVLAGSITNVGTITGESVMTMDEAMTRFPEEE